MNNSSPQPDDSAAIADAAAAWLARHDRGLTAVEQDAFFQWLSDDSRHRAALANEERTWATLNALAKWQPANSARPNPDLLAPARLARRRHTRTILFAAGLATAAAIAGMIFSLQPTMPDPMAVTPGLRVIPRPERLTLSDGSIAELNHGGKFEIAFTTSERRVRLLSGELYVTVEKNPARPFVVEVNGVTVRALGTAFNVRRGRESVEVLVTHGRVQLETSAADNPRAEAVPVASGERARIETSSPESRPSVSAASAAEIERELAWQGVRLEFEALPLAAVVTEFNLRNAQQLAIGNAAAGQVKVAGTFRADQVEAFVRMLEASFGITVQRRTDAPWELRAE